MITKYATISLVACVIKKPDHLEKYGLDVLDPYLLSFSNLLSPFILDISKRGKGMIIAEKRNSALDNQLELAWLNIKINGTESLTGSQIKAAIENLYLIPKSENEAGLQIADLIANPIGRNVLKIKRKPGHEVDYSVIESKLSKKKNNNESLGIIILPK